MRGLRCTPSCRLFRFREEANRQHSYPQDGVDSNLMSRCVGLSSAYECCAPRITSHDGPQDVENVLPVSDEDTTGPLGDSWLYGSGRRVAGAPRARLSQARVVIPQ
jgi:hypothetical protein